MPRPFFETLRELRKGKTLEDLTAALADLVTAVQTTGKGGEIILRLRIRPPRPGSIAYITIEDELVTKLPKADRGDTVFFPLAFTVSSSSFMLSPSTSGTPLLGDLAGLGVHVVRHR